jgi:hypothetical protein
MKVVSPLHSQSNGAQHRAAAVDWLNVREHGVVGDGTTDDTTRLQACIDAASNTNILSTNDASFETDATGWTQGSNTTLTRDATHTHAGSWAGKLVSGTSGAISISKAVVVEACAGATYAFSAWVWSSVSTTAALRFDWKDGASSAISSSTSGNTSLTASAFTLVSFTATAPTTLNVRRVTPVVTVVATGSAQSYWVDDLSFSGTSSGAVYLPAGVYRTTAALNLAARANVRMFGAGIDRTTITQVTSNTNGIHGYDLINCDFDGFTLTGTGGGTGSGFYLEWSVGGSNVCEYMGLRSVRANSWGSHGFYLKTPIVSHLDRAVAQSNGGDGFFVDNGGTSTTFTSCYAKSNTANGYHFVNTVYTVLNACAADNNAAGYLVDGSDSLVLNGCGSEAQATGIKITAASGISVISNWNYNNLGKAIWVTGSSSDVVLMGCQENTPGGGATNHIIVDSGSQCLVMENDSTSANSYSTATTRLAAGDLYLGGGAVTWAADAFTSVYRTGSHALRMDGNMAFGEGATSDAAPTVAAHLARKDYVDLKAPDFLPADNGMLAWNFDPMEGVTNPTTGPVSQTVYTLKVKIPKDMTVSNIVVAVTAAGVTFTSSSAALYNASTGAKIVETASMNAVWNSTGIKTMAIAATALTAGYVIVAIRATATTPPKFGGVNAPSVDLGNVGLGASDLRFASGPTSQTSLPSSITLSSRSNYSTSYPWVGLS